MFTPTFWEDHTNSMPGVYVIRAYNEAEDQYTITEAGTVMVAGTPQDQTHFQNLENGILDSEIVSDLLLNFARQLGWSVDDLKAYVQTKNVVYVGTVTLTNSQKFPFNNSVKTVSLGATLPNTYYDVNTKVTAFTGNVGEVEVTDKLTNGFKLQFTGSASSATIAWVAAPQVVTTNIS